MGPFKPVGYSFIHELIEERSFNRVSKNNRNICIISDLIKVGGYFPGVGVITGVARLALIFNSIRIAKKDGEKIGKDRQFLIGQHVARAVLEIMCVFGPVLLVADIAYTAFDCYKQMQEKNKGFQKI